MPVAAVVVAAVTEATPQEVPIRGPLDLSNGDDATLLHPAPSLMHVQIFVD